MKKSLYGAISAIMVLVCCTILQIYAISWAFVDGNIALGVLLSITFIAYLVWVLSAFLQ